MLIFFAMAFSMAAPYNKSVQGGNEVWQVMLVNSGDDASLNHFAATSGSSRYSSASRAVGELHARLLLIFLHWKQGYTVSLAALGRSRRPSLAYLMSTMNGTYRNSRVLND